MEAVTVIDDGTGWRVEYDAGWMAYWARLRARHEAWLAYIEDNPEAAKIQYNFGAKKLELEESDRPVDRHPHREEFNGKRLLWIDDDGFHVAGVTWAECYGIARTDRHVEFARICLLVREGEFAWFELVTEHIWHLIGEVDIQFD